VRSEVQVLPGPPFRPGIRGRSSAGRAPALQAGGRRFDPVRLHHTGDRVVGFIRKNKVCGRLLSLPPVLFDIVKRRFVRTPWPEHDPRKSQDFATGACADGCGLSQGTLNPSQMIGLPNRTTGQISRSWSFCANTVRSLLRMGIGNENDQVS
jgi:hypothetical protein